jgi:hypothetical protein
MTNYDNLGSRQSRAWKNDFYKMWVEDPSNVEPTPEDIKCELQLSAYSTVEPLDFEIDYSQFKKEIEPWNDKWVYYLKRPGSSNPRYSLALTGMPGDKASEYMSRPETTIKYGRKVDEVEFCHPTDLYNEMTCLHELLNFWQPVGRTMLFKVDAGGYFYPHKDEPWLRRSTFRVAAFIGESVDHESFEWESDGRVWQIKPNRVYYIDTRKTHRTHSWRNGSIHVIMNVPKTWENILKLMTKTLYY